MEMRARDAVAGDHTPRDLRALLTSTRCTLCFLRARPIRHAWPRSFRSPIARSAAAASATRRSTRCRARRGAGAARRARSPTRAAGRCATCASRSPTAATSAASTACRRRSSARDYRVPAARGAPDLRGDRARRADLRRPRRREDPADRRRAAAAPQHRAAGRDAGEARRRRPHADDQRRAAREEGAEPRATPGSTRVTVSLDSLDDATFRAMNDVDFPGRQGARGHRRRGGRRPRAAQDQHGGEARHQRVVDRADGAPLQGQRAHRPLHRVHGRRRDQRLADGRRRARGRDRRARSTPSCRSRAPTRTTPAKSRSAGATATAAARSASSRR